MSEDLVQTASEIADARGGHQDAELEAQAREVAAQLTTNRDRRNGTDAATFHAILSALRSAVEAEREPIPLPGEVKDV